MELEQLKEQENYLRKELSTISAKIENYSYRELEKPTAVCLIVEIAAMILD